MLRPSAALASIIGVRPNSPPQTTSTAMPPKASVRVGQLHPPGRFETLSG